MITQNPIVGRSRKRLAGVYARTYCSMNIIQSLPKPTTIPPTQALRDSRAAFATVRQMAAMFPASLLPQIYYTAPVGKTRRSVFMSQLFQGVVRENKQITFNESEIHEIGSNPVVTSSNIPITVPSKDFSIPLYTFNATEVADTSRVPLIIALHYPLRICQSWLPYTQIEGNNLVFRNISDTLVNEVVFLICLWQTNMGSSQIPVWTFGRFEKFN
jgi:hypothetical protein